MIPIIEILLRHDTPLGKHQVAAIVIEPTRSVAFSPRAALSRIGLDGLGCVVRGGEMPWGCVIRELAKQVADVLEQLLAPVPQLSFLLLTGGHSLAQDAAAFRERGASIVIATPGRLNELMTRMADFNTKELDVLVLDEADRCDRLTPPRRQHRAAIAAPI